MAETSFDLLSPAEVEEIRRFGFSEWPAKDLVKSGTDGRVVFTVKGVQHHKLALKTHLPGTKLHQVSTLADLRDLSRAIQGKLRSAIRAQMAFDLDTGRTPAEQRNLVRARLHGSVGDQAAALEQQIRCQAAGKNIVPFPAADRGSRPSRQ